MKTFTNIAILFCLLTTAISCSRTEGGTVYLENYLEEGQAQIDAMPAIRKALEFCRETKADSLVLPEGVLKILPDFSYEKYQFISNNTESLKRIAFDLDGMNDFKVVGKNTKLLFTGFISPFSAVGCKNVSFKGFSVDYTRTFHSEAEILAVGDGYMDLRFPEDYKYNIINGCLYFTDDKRNNYLFSSLLEFDAKRREPAYLASDYWLSKQTIEAKPIKDHVVRIFHKDIKGTLGNIMVLGATARYNPAFFISNSENIGIRDVTLYHCGGMGVIAQSSEDIELLRLKVIPAEGRMISITADATHFVNCKGYIKMIDCIFHNQKDDATNIHGWYMAVDKIVSPTELYLRWRNSGQYGIDFLNPGDRIEFVDNTTLEILGYGTVKSSKLLNKQFANITLHDSIPERLKEKMVIAEDNSYPDVLISGCNMRGNRARGLLLGSRGKIVIENNYFSIPGAAILFEGDGNYWYEQSGVRDVVIRNNVFENGNFGYPTWGRACIAVGSGIPNKEAGVYYHQNILIENNTFKVFDPRILNLYSVDGLTFKNNTIEKTDYYPYTLDEQNPFVQNYCKNINIK